MAGRRWSGRRRFGSWRRPTRRIRPPRPWPWSWWAGWKRPSRPWPPGPAPRSCRSCWVWPARKATWASGAVLDVTTGAVQGPCLPERGRPAGSKLGRPTILPSRRQPRDDLAWEVAGPPRWPAMTLQGQVLAGRYALGALLGAGAWARCTGPATECWNARWPSRCSAQPPPMTVSWWPGSAGRPGPPPPSTIPTSWRSSTAAPTATCTTWSWSTCKARAWPRCCAARACWSRGGSPRLDARCARRWRRRMLWGWSVATSRPATCWSTRRGWSRWPTTDRQAGRRGHHDRRRGAAGHGRLPVTRAGPGPNRGWRSDLYALSCVLYELVTGAPPFAGDSPVAVAARQVTEQPIPPSHRNPRVSPALEAVVLTALAKQPADRYQSAAMAQDLDRVIADAGADSMPLVDPGAGLPTDRLPSVIPARAARRRPGWVPWALVA